MAPKDPSLQALSGFGIIARRRTPWTNLLVRLVVCATEGMARQIHKRWLAEAGESTCMRAPDLPSPQSSTNVNLALPSWETLRGRKMRGRRRVVVELRTSSNLTMRLGHGNAGAIVWQQLHLGAPNARHGQQMERPVGGWLPLVESLKV